MNTITQGEYVSIMFLGENPDINEIVREHGFELLEWRRELGSIYFKDFYGEDGAECDVYVSTDSDNVVTVTGFGDSNYLSDTVGGLIKTLRLTELLEEYKTPAAIDLFDSLEGDLEKYIEYRDNYG